jgi:hypothetical protein
MRTRTSTDDFAYKTLTEVNRIIMTALGKHSRARLLSGNSIVCNLSRQIVDIRSNYFRQGNKI